MASVSGSGEKAPANEDMASRLTLEELQGRREQQKQKQQQEQQQQQQEQQ